MPLGTDATSWLLGQATPWLLVLARVSGACWTAPVLSTPGLGGRGRVALSIALTALIAPVVGPELPAMTDPWALGVASGFELAIGAGLGWAGALVIAGARQAGEVVGAQSGLSPAALFDPEAGDGLTAMGHLYALVAVGVFLGLDGPSRLVLALAESYRVVPPVGSVATASPEVATWAFEQVARALELALRASAPPALALTLAGLALGLLGRASPSLQLVSLSLPARTLIGLAVAALGLATLAATLGVAWQGAFAWVFAGR